MADTHPDHPTLSAQEALQRLIEGNERFLRGEARFPTVCKETLADLARGQHPYATILGCSDSRVPPELLFDANFGELFIVRVAGNVVSAEVMGSLQYAGSHPHTPLFVVLGSSGMRRCRCCTQYQAHGTEHKSRIQILLDGIEPGLSDPDPHLSPEAQLEKAVEENLRWSIGQLLATPEGKSAVEGGRATIIGAVYEIATGKVRFLA